MRGLAVGAPVEFRGLPFGRRGNRIGLDYNPATFEFATPVESAHPDRLRERLRRGSDELQLTAEARMRLFVDHGLRGQLRTASLLTGQRFVAVDFFPAAPRVKLDPVRRPREIPTLASDGDDLQASLAGVVRKIDQKIDRLPLDELDRLSVTSGRCWPRRKRRFSNLDAAVGQFGPSSPRQADLGDLLRANRAHRTIGPRAGGQPQAAVQVAHPGPVMTNAARAARFVDAALAGLAIAPACLGKTEVRYYTLAGGGLCRACAPGAGPVHRSRRARRRARGARWAEELVLRVSDTQVAVDDNHRWAEPLRTGIARAVAGGLGPQAGWRAGVGLGAEGGPATQRCRADD